MIQITTNAIDIARSLAWFSEKGVQSAVTNAINSTAFEVRKQLVADLPKHFTIRSNWEQRNIRYTKASKKDKNPTAYVGSRSPHMALQAEGGKKTGAHGSTIVPYAARPTQQSKTTRGKMPARLTAKKNFFKARFDGPGGSYIGVFERVGLAGNAVGPVARGKRLRRTRLKLWWVELPKVEIPPIWPFFATTTHVIEKVLWMKVREAMAYQQKRSRGRR